MTMRARCSALLIVLSLFVADAARAEWSTVEEVQADDLQSLALWQKALEHDDHDWIVKHSDPPLDVVSCENDMIGNVIVNSLIALERESYPAIRITSDGDKAGAGSDVAADRSCHAAHQLIVAAPNVIPLVRLLVGREAVGRRAREQGYDRDRADLLRIAAELFAVRVDEELAEA